MRRRSWVDAPTEELQARQTLTLRNGLHERHMATDTVTADEPEVTDGEFGL